MELRFLGAATTVTGSQFLLTTARASVLIDCGIPGHGRRRRGVRSRSRATAAAFGAFTVL
ncbi:MAG TPA: hypothetical protein VGK07_01260 [Candidatus Limnocylindria bacterium]|jgi:Cft2 family RNA processing exonuclease